jgi:hypothetical protein
VAVELKDVENLLDQRRKNPRRVVGLIILMAIVSGLTIVGATALEELTRDVLAGYKHSPQPATGGTEGSESFALKGPSSANIGINLGKEYPLKNTENSNGLRILNLSKDFKEDTNLKTSLDLSNTFCYLGEVRGPLTGQEGADLEIQNDETSGEPIYMLYLYGNQTTSGVVRVSCVKILSPPPGHLLRDLWRSLWFEKKMG